MSKHHPRTGRLPRSHGARGRQGNATASAIRAATASFALPAGALVALAGVGCGGTVTVITGEGGAGGESTTTTYTNTTYTNTTYTNTTYTNTTYTNTTYTTTTTTTTSEGGAPPIPALVEYDLGEVPVGQPIGFDVPAGTISITAMAHADWKWDEISFDWLYAPSGAAIVQNTFIPGTAYPFYWNGDIGMQVPQDDDSDSMPLSSGLWQFVVGSPGNATTQLSIWRRQTVDGLFHGGVIDFNVFMVPGASTESYMTNLLHQAVDGFAGLGAGTITFYPLDSQWAVIDWYDAFPLFEETGAATTRPAINIMVVQAYDGDLASAGGFSMGIPAMALRHGTYQSGMSMLCMQDPWWDRIVVTHELGHMAGLFHTTEIEPGAGDPLEDTPSCPDVEAMGYGCPDGSNLMFPYGPSGDGELSARQLAVLRASAVYRGRVEEGGAPAYPLPGPSRMGVAPDDAIALQPDDGSALEPGAETPFAVQSRPPVRADRAPWAAGLPPVAAMQLAGLWDPTWRGSDPFERLERAGANDPKLLMEIARHPLAPAHVRMRARMAAGRLSPSSDVVRELAATAADAGATRFDRLGALAGLASADPPRARRVAAGLRADPESAIAAVAARMAR